MALLHLEGFEGLGREFELTGTNPNATELVEYLDTTNGYSGTFSGGTSSLHLRRSWDGKSLALGTGNDSTSLSLQVDGWTALATTDAIIIGVRVKFPATLRTATPLIQILDGATVEAQLIMDTGNVLRVQYGTSNTVASTVSSIFEDNGWHYIEWKTVLDSATSGSYELRVDGVDVASNTGVRTAQNAAAQADGVVLLSSGGADNTYAEQHLYDDWYICDDTGTLNNDFLGPISITLLEPNLPGTYSSWSTFGTSQPVANINPNPTVDDTTGIQSDDTPGTKQTYTMNEYHSGSIVGVRVDSRSIVTIDPITVAHRIESGASNDNASSYEVTDTVAHEGFFSLYETDPNTSSAWTQTGLSDAEFGVEIVA